MDLDSDGLSEESKEKIDNYNENEKSQPIKKKGFCCS